MHSYRTSNYHLLYRREPPKASPEKDDNVGYCDCNRTRNCKKSCRKRSTFNYRCTQCIHSCLYALILVKTVLEYLKQK